MLFTFNVELTEKDHYEFCEFMHIRSFYGKRFIRFYRIVFSVVVVLGIIVLFLLCGFTKQTINEAKIYCEALILFQIIFIPIMKIILKSQMKRIKKLGKLPYSPFSVMEFFENCFIETLPEEKIERSYSTIERISIVEEKMIYIHLNSSMANLIPIRVFENPMQKEKFIQFLKTKCCNIDWYRE